MVVSVGLDLGTTLIKSASMNGDGSLTGICSLPAPELSGSGLIRESDPELYFARASDLLEQSLAGQPESLPVGMAAQRSSFLLWERESGNCVTPLISWEDRRCHEWCQQHEEKLSAMLSSTGLQLTPHYPAPKLAFIMEQDRGLKSKIDNGQLMFGQIDSYCLWRWSQEHQVDLSMAARTLFMNIKNGQWSDELLTYFGIQESILPLVVSSCSRKIHLGPGGMLTASVADQSAAMLSTLGLGDGGTLVNLGTGGFVSKFLGQEICSVPGYLTGPVCALSDGTVLYSIEGTINGIGALLDSAVDDKRLSDNDLLPDLYCIPDSTGLGAPFWRPDLSTVWSGPIDFLDEQAIKKVLMEGIIFRIVQIIEQISTTPGPVYLSGGLSKAPFIREGLASVLQQEIRVLSQEESTLHGACLLAVGMGAWSSPSYSTIYPRSDSCYLSEKWLRWNKWIRQFMR